jgi:phosphoserine aminotransferase
MAERVFNFSPGPAVLPLPVLEQAQRDLVALPGVGASVLEISHRSKAFEGILADAKSLLTELLGIPSGYTILFLQGGSNLQFSMIPMNLLKGTGKSADYIVTGTWGAKALEEAKREGEVRVAWDGKASNYDHLPTTAELKLDPNAAYVHSTSNETIQGVQFQSEPEVGNVPLVCDLSSDFLSRPVPVNKYGLIYACAQKNAGISGVTVVIIRNDLLERTPNNLPCMLDYKLFAKNDSLYNTPPTFAIYVTMLIGKWLRDEVGGLAKMDERNREKAQLLYSAIDASGGFYRPHAKPECRSQMNVTFRLPSEELETKFVKEAQALKLTELKGHRSVGGIRASIYNAMPREGVAALREFMLDFQKKNG